MTQRRPTSFDIAALAGVSQPTVSRALSGHPAISAVTRARVLAAAEQVGYGRDESSPESDRHQLRRLALLLLQERRAVPDSVDPFHLSMLSSMVRTCTSLGYDLLVRAVHLTDEWYVQGDGVILLECGNHLHCRARLEELAQARIPLACWGNPRLAELGASVSSDNEAGGFEASRHLLGLGRRQVAFVGTTFDDHPEFLDRYRGYVRAHDQASLSVLDGLRVNAEPSMAAGCAAVLELERRHVSYDAIFAASDLAAMGAMQALQERGRRVPQDVAVVGFGDIAAASSASPPLSTVAQDPDAAGTALVEALIERIGGRESAPSVLPVTLRIRGSSLC